MTIAGWSLAIAQTVLFALLAPIFTGYVKLCKSFLQNRTPASLIQPWRDIRKLFAKEVLLPDTASIIFRIAPYIVFGTSFLAALIVPFILVGVPTSAMADAIVLVGIISFGRFFLALAGLDVGTTFGGMGSSREMMVSALAEPAMLMVVFTVAMVASSTNLSTVMLHTLNSAVTLRPSVLFAFAALLCVGIAETGRIPVDNPSTHLEVTMIHEAMILEYTGRHLALMEYAAQLKLMLYATLIVNLFLPWGIAVTASVPGLALALLAILLKLAVLGLVLALCETSLAKMRVFKVPTFLMVAFSIALVGMLSFVILESV